MNRLELTQIGEHLEVTLNNAELSGYKVTHEFKKLSIFHEGDLIFQTDSEKYLNFIRLGEVLEVKRNQNDIFEFGIYDTEHLKRFSIIESVDLGWKSNFYEYYKVYDLTSGRSFIIEYNPWRFFLPFKLKVYFEKDVVETVLCVSTYILLKIKMTSHDVLN